MCLNVPDYMRGNVQDLINKHLEIADLQILEAQRKSSFGVVLGLVPFRDGNEWCVLWGDDVQSGIRAFGKTPSLALLAFNDVMISK